MCASCGTIRTRITARKNYVDSYQHEDAPFFGKHPYQAITDDIEVMRSTQYVSTFGVGLESRPYSRFRDYMTIPFDVVFDTVFLPCDLLAWACGYEKGWRGYRSIKDKKPNKP